MILKELIEILRFAQDDGGRELIIAENEKSNREDAKLMAITGTISFAPLILCDKMPAVRWYALA